MNELGHILREARETKGLTLTQVQDRIRINTKFLEAMENGRFESLPSPVHGRGFLRNYARFLELEPEPLLRRYEATLVDYRPTSNGSNNGRTSVPLPQQPLPVRDDQPFFNPVNLDLDGTPTRSGAESTLRIVIILALLVAIGLAASRFVPMLLGQGDGQADLTEAVEQLLQPATAESVPTGTTNEMSPMLTTQPITSTNRNSILPALPTLSPPTPTRPALPVTMDTIRLRLDITERTWLQVTIDGAIVFNGMAKQGDEPYFWEAQQEAHVLSGNAIGVFVTINDIPLGKMGERGAVGDETWQTTNN